YLGLGCILLLAAALLLVLSQLFTALWHSKKIPVMLRSHRNLLLYGAAFLIIVFFAASNELSFGSALLLKVPLPQKLLDLWGTFRASGRMIWPAVYMLMLFSIVICIRKLPKRLSVILLFCCLFLQILDLKDMLYEKHQEFTSRQTYESCLQNEFWTDILTERSLQHIVFYDKENLTQEQLYSFAEYAARNQFTINDFYFSRALSYPITDVAKDFFSHPDDHTLYIMTYDSYQAHYDYTLSYYTFDGFIIGLKTSR
ncbi:MAG TPA: hypothetical protein PLU43_06245, partial [Lachnospiraceae bacterium]|nr:hypothetical protein [Lachnospiraceae bacterium]